MLNEWRGPLPEDHQLFLYHFFVIINPHYSVPSHIISDAAENSFCRTIQNNKCMNISNARDVVCLPHMPWYTVQHENIALLEIHTVQEQRDDLLREWEMIVFKKEAALQNTMNKIELRGRISSITFPI